MGTGRLREFPEDTRVLVTQVRSSNGQKPKARRTLRALGLRGVGQSRCHTVSPSVNGMIAKVDHLVRAEPMLGSIRSLSPPLDRGPASKAGPRHSYELPTGETGLVATTKRGVPYRVEQRSDGVVVGWHPDKSRAAVLKRIHALGDPSCRFSILKAGKLVQQDPWAPALPIEIVESPAKVDIARLDTDEASIVWENESESGRPDEIRVYAVPADLEKFEPLLRATADQDVTDALIAESQASSDRKRV